MFDLQRRSDIREVVLATTVSWLPLVLLGAPHRIAYTIFAALFIVRFIAQPPRDAPLTTRRRILLAVLGWSALGALVWSWIPIFRR